MIIIIPCYNESIRLPINDFEIFIKDSTNTKICFVNDGSTDDTHEILNTLMLKFPDSVFLLKNEANKGKAETIRFAVNYLVRKKESEIYAYLDADLATSLEECRSYVEYIRKGGGFVFASRILKIGSVVERKFSRFLFGRIIATFISAILDVKVYDTQCGCKVFTQEIAEVAFKDPFISKWLFDVEIFSRIIKKYGKVEALQIMEEIPVKRWIDKGESKVKLSYFFRLWIDLYRIWKSHKS